MTYTVWHADVPTFFDAIGSVLAAEFPKGFTPVAHVTTEDVGAVFQLTNSIDSAWYDLEPSRYGTVVLSDEGQALKARQGGIRSTSVGDVYTAFADGGKIDRWTVKGLGLEKF